MEHARARPERVDESHASPPPRLRAVEAPARERAVGAPAALRSQPGLDPARRTVEITGRPGVTPRRRPRPTAERRLGAGPDRLARWAVVLGLLLALVAALSGGGSEGGDGPPVNGQPAAPRDGR